ncbi:hypothetical protein NDU88_004482 [Pleurodeles waltl]|uniref:Uncharacterized protein n=1 Tax=Pleurodeles waltl TaxID=8319 RepID=A0AAV7RIW5_PLEWA|nr:hypothetical protein NDU88_004482 [Pleurodeles waltl]
MPWDHQLSESKSDKMPSFLKPSAVRRRPRLKEATVGVEGPYNTREAATRLSCRYLVKKNSHTPLAAALAYLHMGEILRPSPTSAEAGCPPFSFSPPAERTMVAPGSLWYNGVRSRRRPPSPFRRQEYADVETTILCEEARQELLGPMAVLLAFIP